MVGLRDAHNILAGPIDRDFGTCSELLGDLLASSLVHVFFDVVFFLFFEGLGDDFGLHI